MTENIKRSPNPIDVQDLQFRKAHTSQIFDPFSLPPNSNNLVAADGKRGLLYIGHHKKLTVLKPAVEDVPESKIEIDLPDNVTYVAVNCDCSYVAICYSRPSILIYDASGLNKKNLVPITELQISTSTENVRLVDLRWNPTTPNMLCTIASDHSIGSFQVTTDKQIPPTKLSGMEPLCVAWSPKGKQLAVGCKSGHIIQLRPELKVARVIAGPTPPMGEVIALLWISNYQFCAAYLDTSNQNITAVIVDAPKGAAQGIFTCYDFLLNRIPEETIVSRFYFEHIAEWGIIVAASNDCQEAAVIGSSDGGATWVIWQMESNARAELPMVNRQLGVDSYPVGLAIDRSTTNKIYLDAENIAKHPFPILHMLGTAGHLVSFYIANFKPESPNVCVPPSEVVVLPKVENISFNIPAAAASTPLAKPVEQQAEKQTLFGTAVGTKPFSVAETPSPFGIRLNLGGEAPSVEPPKSVGLFGGSEPKIVEVKSTFPVATMETPKATTHYGFPLQKEPSRTAVVPAKPVEPPVQYEQKSAVKETTPTKPVAKASTPEKKYNDAIYLQVYQREWEQFESEIKRKLENLVWKIGTEEEKQMLVKKTASNEEGLAEMINTLSDEVACTKSLLLQSFEWLEEAKSRRTSSSSVGGRNKNDHSKMKERENCLYYLQSQVQQINNSLDLKWLEEKTSKEKKLKIPNVEFLYMTLLRQEQVLQKQKANLDMLAKRVKSVRKTVNVSSLNQSMSSLNISKISRDDYGVEMRCKAIASRQKNLTRLKNVQLKDLLTETTPKIIKSANPSSVQDRLNATLSSLAMTVKPDEPPMEIPSRPRAQVQTKVPQQQGSLPMIDNLISRLGTEVTPIQASFQLNNTTTVTPKVSSFSPVTQAAAKSKATVTTQASTMSSFPKLDSLQFGMTSTPKAADTKESFMKRTAPPEQPKVETKPFSNFSIKSVLAPATTSLSETSPIPKSASAVNLTTSPKTSFGLTSQPFGSKPAGLPFGASTTSPLGTQNSTQSLLQRLQQPEFSVSSPQLTSAAPMAPMPSPLVFTPQTSPLFTKAAPTTTSSPSSIASGLVISPAFCKSTTTTIPTSTIPDKLANVLSTSSLTSVSPATQPVATFGSVTVTPTAEPPTTSTPTISSGLLFGSQPVTSTTMSTTTSTTPSTFSFTGNAAVSFSTTGGVTSTSATSTTTSPSSFSNSLFGGMLSSTPSLSFGTPSSASATTSLFGGKTATSPPAPTIFGQKLPEGGSMTFGSLTITPTTSTPAPPASTNLFGSSASTAATATTTTTTTSIFGGSASTFSATSQPFGTASTGSMKTWTGTPIAAETSFGATPAAGKGPFGATTGVTAFGTPTATTGVTAFGTPTATTGVTAFGTPTATTGVTAFGTPTATTSVLSAPTFGGPVSTAPVSGTTFGTAVTSAPTFGGGAVFGTNTANTGASVFGTPTSSAPSFGTLFGAANSATNTSGSGSIFGSKSPGGTTGSIFGGTAAAGFGAASPPPVFGGSGAGIFGGASQPGSPIGGGLMSGAAPVFGQSATFGAKPVFGSPTAEFGAKSVFGSGFGSPPAFGAAATGTEFGSPPAMGAALPQMGTPGSMDKVFGGGGAANTFESLSFGSLAQKTTEPPQQPPAFSGGSSFSSWR